MEQVTKRIRVYDLTAEGRKLSSQSAADLEKHLISIPDDIDARVKLLGHLFGKTFFDNQARSRAVAQLTWMITNHPEHPLLSMAEGSPHFLKPHEYQQLKECWQKQIDGNYQSARILFNASNFFLFPSRDYAIKLLERARELEPSDLEYLDGLAFGLALGIEHFRNEERAKRALEVQIERVKLLTRCDYPRELSRLAKIAYYANDLDKATSFADKVIACKRSELDSSDLFDARTILGLVKLRTADRDAAISELRQLSGSNSDLVLANSLLQAGEKQAVCEHLFECSRRCPDKTLQVLIWYHMIESDHKPELKRTELYQEGLTIVPSVIFLARMLFSALKNNSAMSSSVM